jgi:hypothetical protein
LIGPRAISVDCSATLDAFEGSFTLVQHDCTLIRRHRTPTQPHSPLSRPPAPPIRSPARGVGGDARIPTQGRTLLQPAGLRVRRLDTIAGSHDTPVPRAPASVQNERHAPAMASPLRAHAGNVLSEAAHARSPSIHARRTCNGPCGIRTHDLAIMSRVL